MIKFNNYTGPIFLDSNAVPIIPASFLSSAGEHLERHQVPLMLSWATKIHKSQGLTLVRTVVDLGASESIAGVAYVAVSKVRKLSNLIVEPMSYERLKST